MGLIFIKVLDNFEDLPFPNEIIGGQTDFRRLNGREEVILLTAVCKGKGNSIAEMEDELSYLLGKTESLAGSLLHASLT